jgi:hypothetical protein
MMKNTLVALGVTLMLAAVACGETPPPASPESKAGAPAAAATPAGAAAQDTDGDGVPDSEDKCPDKKEDGLGKEPKDGCPDGHPWARTHPTPN